MLLSSISLALTRLGQRLGRWSPLALWPDGIDSPGMWISPRTLTSEWQDYTGTTPVVEPGTVADSSNPVGLALDIRAGAPEVLGPELVTDGWAQGYQTPAISVSGDRVSVTYDGGTYGRATSPIVCVIGRQYRVSITLVSSGVPVRRAITTQSAGVVEVAYTDSTTPGTWSAVFTATDTTLWVSLGLQGASAGQTGVFEGVTCKEVPGNHMLQSTSAARPLLSARVNLLNYSEDFSNAVWTKAGCTPTNNYGVAPDGTTTAARLLFSGANVLISQLLSAAIGTSNSGVWIKGVVGETVLVTVNAIDTPPLFTFTGAWQQYEISDSPNPVDRLVISTYLSATARDVLVWHPQISIGTTALPYQPILTDGSSYSSTGFPIAQLYDGVDDGMATAAFSAGTLINGMDCLIAVRRDSAANVIAGLYIGGSPGYFGAAQAASGTDNSYLCGTPQVWVDNQQLTGGGAVSMGTLHTALTPGECHILEFRDLDLSAWTAASVAGFGSGFNLNGAIGDILLYPSTASTEDKDAARQWLADYYGVTLP